jgi:predicted PurR-regulated permease PerM
VTTRTPAESRALIRYAIVMTALAGIILWCGYIVRNALLIVYVSGVLAIGFSPIVRILERQRLGFTKRVPRWLAILILYLAILGTVALVIILILPPLVDQAQALWNRIPEMFERTQQFLISKGWLKEHLTMQEAVERAPGSRGDAVGRVARTAASLAGGIFGVVTILILTFYMLVDGESFVTGFVRLFPRSQRTRIREACRSVSTKVSAWLVGQLLLASTIGSTAALGLYILGVPYFYVLALIAAIGEMIPIVGPVISAVPAVLVALTVSPTLALAVIIFFLVQQQLENHILVPKIMERQVGVSAVMVIVSLLLGGSLLGIVGAILAIPTAAILQVLFYEIWPEAAPDT